MKTRITITADGTSSIDLEVTPEELAFVRRLAAAFNEMRQHPDGTYLPEVDVETVSGSQS